MSRPHPRSCRCAKCGARPITGGRELEFLRHCAELAGVEMLEPGERTRPPLTATLGEFLARGQRAQRAVDDLVLTPALRTCSYCGYQTDKGAGAEGNLCPLLSCPGDLR